MRVSTPGSVSTAMSLSQAPSTNVSLPQNTLNHFSSTPEGLKNDSRLSTKSDLLSASENRTNSPVTRHQTLSSSWPAISDSTYSGSIDNRQLILASTSSTAFTPQQRVGYGSTTMSNSGGKQYTNLTQVLQTNPLSIATPKPNVLNPMLIASTKQSIGITSTSAITRPSLPATMQLPQGITIPPGMMLARNQTGQLLLVNSNSVPNASSETVTSTPVIQGSELKNTKNLNLKTESSELSSSVVPSLTIANPVVPVSKDIKRVSGKPNEVATKAQESDTLQASENTQPITLSQEDVVNVTKCRNFLTTLIKLASAGGQSATTISNVKKLVQNLIDDKIEPEHFTQQLQIELNSAPQPYLVPFLKRSLPLLRLTMMQQSGGKSSVPATVAAAALRASSVNASSQAVVTAMPNSITYTPNTTPQAKRQLPKPKIVGKKNSVPDIRLPRVSASPLMNQIQPMSGSAQTGVNFVGSRTDSLSMPPPSSMSVSPRHAAQKWTSSTAGVGTFKDDDDINDVASMAGVNLSEESARILATNSELVGSQIRSCKDSTVVNSYALTRRISDIVLKHPHIKQISPDIISFAAHAAEARMKDLVEKVSLVAFHRISNLKASDQYEASQDVKTQLRFLLQLDQLEKKRHAESEREVLMRAMKSRSKNEDPEQLRLKQRAKEMQQLELEKMQIQNADETARNAIGPRKKRPRFEVLAGKVESKDLSSPLRSTTLRPRIKRVNARDLIFVMEQEKDTNKSKFLYKSYLK